MKVSEVKHRNEEDCLGLGFSSSNSSQSALDPISTKAKPNTIEFYFQQAFSHQSQQQFQQKQDQAQKIYQLKKNGHHDRGKVRMQRQYEKNVQNSDTHITQSANNTEQQNIEQAKQTAQAIALKFHTQSTLSAAPKHSVKSNQDSQMNERPFLKQELIQFEDSFQRRLQKAFLKNLEYISRKDEEALKVQLQNIEQSKEYDKLLEHNSSLVYKERQKVVYGNKNDNNKAELTTKAGIGTGIRKRQSKKERNQVYGHIEDCRKKNSLYVEGIRTQIDGMGNISGTENAYRTEYEIHKDIFRLFESYGSIHKLKLYKNHTSGKLKGDGLIIYDKNVDLSSICMQVSSTLSL